MFSNNHTTRIRRSNPSFRTDRGDSGPPRSPRTRWATPAAELRSRPARLPQGIGIPLPDAAGPASVVAISHRVMESPPDVRLDLEEIQSAETRGPAHADQHRRT